MNNYYLYFKYLFSFLSGMVDMLKCDGKYRVVWSV